MIRTRQRRASPKATDPAEVRRLVRWYDGITADYAAAIAPTGAHPLDGELALQMRVARKRAADLRAWLASR